MLIFCSLCSRGPPGQILVLLRSSNAFVRSWRSVVLDFSVAIHLAECSVCVCVCVKTVRKVIYKHTTELSVERQRTKALKK